MILGIDTIKSVYYAIFFNIIAVGHYWFLNNLKTILQINFGIKMESELTAILVDKNSYFSVGLIISGFTWPYI